MKSCKFILTSKYLLVFVLCSMRLIGLMSYCYLCNVALTVIWTHLTVHNSQVVVDVLCRFWLGHLRVQPKYPCLRCFCEREYLPHLTAGCDFRARARTHKRNTKQNNCTNFTQASIPGCNAIPYFGLSLLYGLHPIQLE
jgi:hypothetical protein